MFKRPSRGLLDFLATALCLWAAAYHTPVGALGRGLVAKLSSTKSTARPLLAYYTGGLYDARDVEAPTVPNTVPDLPALALTPPGAAMGRGLYATLTRLGPSATANANALAHRYQLTGIDTPDDASRVLDRAKSELGTDDAAALAVFTGFDIASYAVRRARAEGREANLESLIRQLPPSSQSAIDGASSSLTLGTAYSLNWPVAQSTRVTSPFGYRTHPTLGTQQLHTGVDLSVPTGTEVKVVLDGVVRRASEDDVNGRVVIVDHGYGVWTAYCHNSRLLVTAGQHVHAGDVISESGTTGRSTGPHLHYQLELAHKPTDPFIFRSSKAIAVIDIPAPRPSGRDALKAAFDHAAVKPEEATELEP